jgi:hypothetical protein
MNSQASHLPNDRSHQGVEVVKRAMYTPPTPTRVGARGRIPRAWHGVLDYVYGALLLASPWMFGFNDRAVDAQIAWVLGAATIFVSLITNYEAGLIRMLPFSMHLFFDVLLGIGLLFSWVHFASGGVPAFVFGGFGAVALLVVLLTRNERSSATGSVS